MSKTSDVHYGRRGGRWASSNAVAGWQQRINASPPCRACGHPMVCGQEKSNDGYHFTCEDTR